MKGLDGLARCCPSGPRHAERYVAFRVDDHRRDLVAIGSSRRREASRPIVGIDSSTSSDGLIPRREAATSSAFAICLLTFQFVTLAFIWPRAAKAASSSRVANAAAQVFAMRSSRATLFDRLDVPKMAPRSVKRSPPTAVTEGHRPDRPTNDQGVPVAKQRNR